jgi:transcriptional regulator with XRE-family HTH domain
MRTEPAVREQLARNLCARRKQLGLSQEALAERCDLDRTEISLLERSRRSPKLDTIVVLARALELGSVGELLEGIR